MKNICIIIVILFLCGFITSACNHKTKANMVQAKRKFAQYIEPQKNNSSHYVDLSEGPRLNYDANLGPQTLNFDFKIVEPYK